MAFQSPGRAFPCRNVRILNNTITGGILICGDPAEGNVVKGNRNPESSPARILNQARAAVEDNQGFELRSIP